MLIIQRVLNRHVEINRMANIGYPVSEIARRLGPDRKTVRHSRDNGLDTLLASARDRHSVPNDRFKPFLHAEFASGRTSGKEPFQRLHEQGYRGGHSTLTRYLRTGSCMPARTCHHAAPQGWTRYGSPARTSPRPATSPARSPTCSDIAEAPGWRTGYARPNEPHRRPLRVSRGFLRQDLDAVTAGLTLLWSSGVVGGHVNRVNTLKRAMYGRASFDPLRIRILTQS
ncbi:hypothetical protein AB0H18_12620 [Streptomyces sp. NPDC020766]|uniref:hypothetical protein n=1 Tax=Streptomyces sp. NPDC020766 TaxID=3155011 RepID=UPI0033D56AF4